MSTRKNNDKGKLRFKVRTAIAFLNRLINLEFHYIIQF
jgi:hypothetical protein